LPNNHSLISTTAEAVLEPMSGEYMPYTRAGRAVYRPGTSARRRYLTTVSPRGSRSKKRTRCLFQSPTKASRVQS
jgi:hypothetical protein